MTHTTTRWISLSLLLLLMGSLLLVGCPGGAESNGATSAAGAFLEEPPAEAEVLDLLEALRREVEPTLDPDLRAEVEAYIAAPDDMSPWEDAVYLAPEGGDDLYRIMGAGAFLGGHEDLALWCWIRAAQLERADNLSQVAFALNERERFEPAITLSLYAVSRRPDDHVPLTNLAYAYTQTNQVARALHYQSQVVALQPEDAWAKARLGDLLLENGQPTAAEVMYRLATIRNPDDTTLQELLDAVDANDPTLPVTGTPGDLLEELEARIADAEAAHSSAIEVIDQDWSDAIDDRFAIKQQNQSEWLDCLATCEGDSLECQATCADVLCALETPAHTNHAARLAPFPGRYEHEYMRFATSYHRVSREVLAGHPEVTPATREAFELEANGEVTATLLEIDGRYGFIQSAIDADRADVEQVCDASEYLQQLLETRRALANQQGSTFDICADGILCIGIDNGVITLSGGVGFIMGDIAIDTSTGDFTLGVGVGLKDPTGTVDLGVSIKYDSMKGAGVGGELKIGGPVKLKYGRDVYFTN